MPKRAASLPEDSPRKVTRRTSKSPARSCGPDVPTDADLMNISEEEEDNNVPSVQEKKATHSLSLTSLQELKALRERFFEKFMHDVTLEDAESVDPLAYQSLVAEIAEDDPLEQRLFVDQNMRDFVVEHMANRRERWDRFLELSIQLARNQIGTGSLPITLISDFLELSSLQQCEEIFEFVEQRLHVWKNPFFLNSGKNAVLRMCNDLLRRLSRPQNTIFCGRILLFLANYFPFSDRSGLNIVSEFNSENITSYKSGDGSDDPDDKIESVEDHDDKLFEGMDIVIPGLDKIVSITQEEKKKKVKVDYNLYVKFWSLQDFFRNPTQCYNKVSWKSFMLYIQDVLGAFTSFKIDGCQTQQHQKSKSAMNAGSEEHCRSHSAINVVPKLGDDDLYFPKYLTNRRLLELQMGDPNFRRYFMVQLLIILQYLTTPVKFKSENQTLSEDQLDFVKKTTDRIFTLLKDMKPGGKDFVKAIQHILKREDLWSKWKNDGCQSFKKPAANMPMDSDSTIKKGEGRDSIAQLADLEEKSEEPLPSTPTSHKKRPLGEIIEEAEKNNRFLLGNPELTRLWNICGDNLEACRSESRDFLPTIDNFFVDAFKELEPETNQSSSQVVSESSKKEVKNKKILGNPNFGWRALRLLARNSPYFFQLAPSPPIQPLQNYLEFILKKIVAEMEIPKEEQLEDNKHENGPKMETVQNTNDGPDAEQVMESEADDNDELLKPDANPERLEEEEEGEVDEKVRNLTEEEQTSIGRLIGDAWKKLALKLHFTKDEIEYFESEKNTGAGSWMLKMWTEQEKEDATAADLLYQLEGLKLRELVREVFP